VKRFLIYALLICNVLFAQETVKPNIQLAVKSINKTKINQALISETTNWKVDTAHTSIEFKVRHLGISKVRGIFSTFNGEVLTNIDLTKIKSAEESNSTDLTKIDFSKTKITGSVEVNSINTDNKKRDEHLKSEDFFDVIEFPKITFESIEFKNAKKDSIDMIGNLTIKDVTKPIVLKITDLKKAKNMQGNYNVGATATTTLDRLLYGIKWNNIIEGVAAVSKNVDVSIQLELIKAN
jgi:polyisoprenoid-binding protein YceI